MTRLKPRLTRHRAECVPGVDSDRRGERGTASRRLMARLPRPRRSSDVPSALGGEREPSGGGEVAALRQAAAPENKQTPVPSLARSLHFKPYCTIYEHLSEGV
ncbi:hypothetical protein MATL_G00040560 [Megalops atlanticus]|uniref:Uncharacterized protein n=1 Tax=Megalops atlanticus TaxID=7932 RepID=A0A9D3TE64_MEGAT|nr:hypothetical protein MATL_G00040560 [Megalops atlanticus]